MTDRPVPGRPAPPRQDNRFVPSRHPEPAFPGQPPPGYELSVEAPRGAPDGVPLPVGGPVVPDPQTVDPQPGRVVTQLDQLPDPGDHPWETRFFAPGLDLSAIDRAAEAAGFLPRLEFVTVRQAGWVEGEPGEKDAGGTLAETMAYAFASQFDQVAKHAAGRTPLLDHRDLLGLLAFGYAACVRLRPGDGVRHTPQPPPQPDQE